MAVLALVWLVLRYIDHQPARMILTAADFGIQTVAFAYVVSFFR